VSYGHSMCLNKNIMTHSFGEMGGTRDSHAEQVSRALAPLWNLDLK
jgi:hypothetical protein